MYNSNNIYDRLSDLHPYYWDHRDNILPALNLKSKFIDFKLIFKSYQTNSTLVHAINYFFNPQIDFNGYRPLFGKIKKPINNTFNERDNSLIKDIDKNNVLAFKSFITTAKNLDINLLFVISPTPENIDSSKNISMSKIKIIAKNENIPLIDFSNDKQFNFNYSLFNDSNHLNNEGAHLFTKSLTDVIIKKNIIPIVH